MNTTATVHRVATEEGKYAYEVTLDGIIIGQLRRIPASSRHPAPHRYSWFCRGRDGYDRGAFGSKAEAAARLVELHTTSH